MNYEKYFRMVVETNHKGVVLLLSQQFLNELNQMLNSKIKHPPEFIKILPSMKKPFLHNTHELLSTKVCDSPLDFIFWYYHQAIDITVSSVFKLLTPKPNKKPPENICGLLLKIKVVKVISMAQVLRDPIIDKPSQHHLLNFRYHWWFGNRFHLNLLNFPVSINFSAIQTWIYF